jgi:hypothetical protein
MLQGGMNSELNMLNPFGRKVICIILVLLTVIGFSFGSAAANSCEGGADCPICANLTHGHVPGAAADMENPGCPQDGQNSPCGFEASQDPDDFRGMVSAVRSYHQVHTGIFAAVSDEYGQTLLPKEFVLQFLLSDSGGTAPIYLFNQALLC